MRFLLLAGALSLAASGGFAATLDFAAEADGNERGGNEILTLDGETVLITGENGDAYLDSRSGGKLAGLGVCSDGLTSSDQCQTASDDNIDANGTNGAEVAVVVFQTDTGQDIIAEEIVVRDDGHNYLTAGETVLVSTDGGATYDQYTVAANGVVDLGDTVVAGNDIRFKRDTASTGSNFYVSSLTVGRVDCVGACTTSITPVPLPAGIWLMLTGVGVLGGAKFAKGRKRHAA